MSNAIFPEPKLTNAKDSQFIIREDKQIISALTLYHILTCL